MGLEDKVVDTENYTMTTDGEIKGLLKKLLIITNSIESIPKSGDNGQYQYVTEQDVVNALRQKLIEQNIVVMPNVVSTSTRDITPINDEKTSITKVVMSYTFFDVETGGFIKSYFQGEGEDTYDKGIYKAITGCQKYAFMKTFLLSTGDDPEETPLPGHNNWEKDENIEANNVEEKSTIGEEVIPETKARQLYKIGKGNKVIIEGILSKYGYKTTFEVQEKNFSIIARELKAI